MSFAVNTTRKFTWHKMDPIASHMKNRHINSTSPILKSLEPALIYDKLENASGKPPSHDLYQQLSSLNLNDDIDRAGNNKSVLLLDDRERLRVNSAESFLRSLNIEPGTKVKVVSIFGNTGEGKSYTLNKVFFDGKEVFRTSSAQTSCTLGVWAMYNSDMNVICLDTEGLLGISKNEHQRTRLLLKVLAVSDIIIYRTRAERLQRDMYTFLGGASKAYKDHFSATLKKVLAKTDCEKLAGGLGPGVIIFHETHYTDTLHQSASLIQSVEDILQSTFADLNLSFDSFCFMKYVGVKTTNSVTSFEQLKMALFEKLESTEVRSPRDAKYVYLTLKSLNEKFQNQISDASPQLYLPAFFTCSDKCQSCKTGCALSMGHKEEGEPHHSDRNCKFQHQYQNCVYLCKICYKNGNKIVVKPSYQTSSENSWSSYLNYVWAGYVIECPNCGEIYRSRQHWYGNKNPEDCAVRIEIVHIWPGEKLLLGSQNSAQKVIDGVTMISDLVASVGSQPKKIISELAADKIAPPSWKSNLESKDCYICRTPFTPTAQKHHCRACGEAVCDPCSSKRQPVPSKGWSTDVRVCDHCYKDSPPSLTTTSDGSENRARVLGETVVNTFAAVKSVVYDKPKELLKDAARPTYWTPDDQCINCAICQKSFGPFLFLHHCRSCGKGVCDNCSKARKSVPLRGWEYPVRVCDNCHYL
ncbi:hypothetical protein NQ315_012735 [Exocentrus adspersus]|uniref:FYVE-type domain-containing protein n=1 Tax=Exocentrus adspersus TaxID=1586481 RepID=A0AAV8VEG3_9CUCU|nr:hypothetical protein NQ315_012735 [Exocentrus adspersus]